MCVNYKVINYSLPRYYILGRFILRAPRNNLLSITGCDNRHCHASASISLGICEGHLLETAPSGTHVFGRHFPFYVILTYIHVLLYTRQHVHIAEGCMVEIMERERKQKTCRLMVDIMVMWEIVV